MPIKKVVDSPVESDQTVDTVTEPVATKKAATKKSAASKKAPAKKSVAPKKAAPAPSAPAVEPKPLVKKKKRGQVDPLTRQGNRRRG